MLRSPQQESEIAEAEHDPSKCWGALAKGLSSQMGKWRDCHSETQCSRTCLTNETWARIELTELREEQGRKSQGWRAQSTASPGGPTRRGISLAQSARQRERPRCLAARPPGNGSCPRRASLPETRVENGRKFTRSGADQRSQHVTKHGHGKLRAGKRSRKEPFRRGAA